MTIYKLEHPEIELYSTNKDTINRLGLFLKGVTVEDIKLGVVPERTKLVLQMYFAGNCPLATEFFSVRNKFQNMLETKLENCDKKHSKYVFVKERLTRETLEEVRNKYGWVLFTI